ncbi:Poly-beta-1,6-N-acetyl-D-glucosamine N-deacetylase [Pandoraea morbifera]|uniref:Poly-beta-1,6-N-acetyl-D-glucosamine N-deacetylase n=1 Tax=Pandoraea morbifera TaxID=2508300 RepID=A0A5E4RK52_9BURK|nr:polysaccharide deacetylase family protein [Pandoraea morbifera]VVD62894.1 Poly-beta-1,6-N-acetyl-D-glucosamine N-deacetylase [Pandoraea morbifera]
MQKACCIAAAEKPLVRSSSNRRGLRRLAVLIFATALWAILTNVGAAPARHVVLILVYHRFSAQSADSTTVRIDTFTSQVRFFTLRGFRIVPLADVLAWHAGGQDTLPERALVLTADDGHRSVFEVLWPALAPHPVPITLFVYPSAISNTTYAMTWDQLRGLARSGEVDIESHTYWHPNFRAERARRSPNDFERFARDQLRRSRARIEEETGKCVRLLAWPFGIYDATLEALAREAGYRYAFSIDARPVTPGSDAMAMPRYLMTQQCGTNCLKNMLRDAQAGHD